MGGADSLNEVVLSSLTEIPGQREGRGMPLHYSWSNIKVSRKLMISTF